VITEDAALTSEPMELKRVTTEMDEAEDRLRLVGEVDSGEPVVFWLTQRLLKRMLPHLLSWLQPSSSASRASPVPDYHTDAVQSFAQQVAVAELPLQTPVLAQPQDSRLLVDSVDITRTPDVIALTFKSGERKAVLLLAQQPLRQWLAILHEQCRTAEWAMDVWPEWIIQSVPTATRQVRATMH
jgi:hypothetical protein